MPTRQELRQTVVDAVKSSNSRLSVFNGSHIDELHAVVPAAIVALDSLAIEQDLSDGYRYSGNIGALIMVNGTDADLDEYLDAAIISVRDAMRSMYPTVGFRLIELTYDREIDPGVAAAQLNWSLEFSDE